MKFSEAWLREWVNPSLDTKALAHELTMLGMEVDSLEPLGAHLDNIVVGEVRSVDAHPNADRLRVCSVSVGGEEPLRIVCGAPNVRSGARYPTALVGATMPGGLKIKRSKIRGEASQGMLCSEVELGLGDAADGIMELPADLPVGEPLATVLALNDSIISVDLTPNRADCFSLLGIARDLGAAQSLPITEPDTSAITATSEATFAVAIDADGGCGRFVGRVVEGIDPEAVTPVWMRERLERSGLRPLHPVVDVTNYVMLELGQPLHGYDRDLLRGKIQARRGQTGERLKLLDDQTIELDPDALVIADDSGPIGLAGIMGGASTAVSAQTTNVFLEAAFFSPSVIAGRARKFGLHTDASVRFERGVDWAQQARAIERATRLLLVIAGGAAGPLVEEESPEWLPATKPVTLRRARLEALLGACISDQDVTGYLSRQQMLVEGAPEGWTVTAPSSRFDIAIEEDLIEEVARMHGYDAIPETPGVQAVELGSATEKRLPMSRLRQTLVARGYTEAITYSFVDAELNESMALSKSQLELSNPISSEMSVMRASLWPGLVTALGHNLSRQQGRVRLFETGVRFLQQDADIIEEEMVAGVVAGPRLPEQWGAANMTVDLYDIKSDIAALLALTGAEQEYEICAAEHLALRPGRSAKIERAGKPIGWLGELHPALVKKLDLASAPVMFEIKTEPLRRARKAEYRGISKYPAVRRDLAVVVSEQLPVADVLAAVQAVGGPVLRETIVFDVYVGDNVESGSKSVALGLILQDTSRTLTDTDVDEIMHSVVERLSRDFNATIRE